MCAQVSRFQAALRMYCPGPILAQSFDPEAAEARYDPWLPLKSFWNEGHWGRG